MVFDMAFYFVCYLTGVLLIKIITSLNTKYNFLTYEVFKETYKDSSRYKKPIFVGFIAWVSILLPVALYTEFSNQDKWTLNSAIKIW